MDAPVDILFRRIHAALTALGVVMLAAALPGAALALLALSAPPDAARPQLAAAEEASRAD